MKLSLLVKKYAAVGLIGALIGGAGVASFSSSGDLLGAADGSWLKEVERETHKNARINRDGILPKKSSKKKGAPQQEAPDYSAPNLNLPASGAGPMTIDTVELDAIKSRIAEFTQTPLLDKTNEAQCRANLIHGNTIITAIGEVRKASVQRTFPLVSQCYVWVLPKGCAEMQIFKVQTPSAEDAANFCNSMVNAAVAGAKVIVIGEKVDGTPFNSVSPMVSMDLYAKGQFAEDLDFSRNTANH